MIEGNLLSHNQLKISPLTDYKLGICFDDVTITQWFDNAASLRSELMI